MRTLRLLLSFALLGVCASALSAASASASAPASVPVSVPVSASPRERIRIDDGWHFAFGHAASPEKDFGRGTEYFNYLTKAASIHNVGPYSIDFQEDTTVWKPVNLPHDFAFGLPFSPEASHSHGYNCIGWKYPENSVGWYRRSFTLSPQDAGKNIRLQFEGIFRDGEVWVNGIWLGRSASGYISHDYDISPYLFYDGRENLICVRCDASLEEGWFYEGAGIYRHAYLVKTSTLHVATNGLFVHSCLFDNYSRAEVTIEATVINDGYDCKGYCIEYEIVDRSSNVVARGSSICPGLKAGDSATSSVTLSIDSPMLWDTENPYLYDVHARVISSEVTKDEACVRTGFREITFNPNQGMFLNGKSLKLKGFNVHQDHAGIGSAIPDGLQVYRMKRLKWMGANALRACHNPSSPALLDVCDSLGILVIEENRLLGINPDQMNVAADMVLKGRNHPCIFTWSVGNEEWGLEWDPRSEDIVHRMADKIKILDPTRPVSVASSSGPVILQGVDIAGYNYIRQHKIDSLAKSYPDRIALGSEETTGCGTRGIYFNEMQLESSSGNEYERFRRANPSGRMPSLGRFPDSDGSINRIERGWKFYDERPYLAGLFYWTGFDYRGEPNPLAYPATGSQFGVLDYCGFAKDEAWYLKSWWKPSEPCIHILPHWNLTGHEGEEVDIWVYSNCPEVELKVNGRSLGRKAMPRNGHLEWKAKYVPGRIEAIGYEGRKITAREKIVTSGPAASATYEVSHYDDIYIVDISVLDSKGNFVPDACVPLSCVIARSKATSHVIARSEATSHVIARSVATWQPPVVLGHGNGDSTDGRYSRPCGPQDDKVRHCETSSEVVANSIQTFNGRAQIIIQSPTDDFTLQIEFTK